VNKPTAGFSVGVSSSGKSVVTGKSATDDGGDEDSDWGLYSWNPASRNRDLELCFPRDWSKVKGALGRAFTPGERERGTTGSPSGTRTVRKTGSTGDAGEESFGGGEEKASSERFSTTCSTDFRERVEEDEEEDRGRGRRRGMMSVRSV